MIQKKIIIKMVATSVRSRKSKGQKLQKKVVVKFRKKFGLDKNEPTCFGGDIQARQMGGSGVDLILSPAAKKIIPFDMECKRQETFSISKWFEQCKTNTEKGRIPLLIAKKNNKKELIIMELDDFLTLL